MSSLGMCKYLLNELFFHLPRVCTIESARAFAAAVLTAPIRNKC